MAAEHLGDPKAVRAVGQANRHNPIAIIVPCHRCIAKSGELQGYFYGRPEPLVINHASETHKKVANLH